VSLLDRLRACDRYDLRDFRPVWIAGRRYGWVRPGFMRRLLERGTVFRPAAGGVALDPALADYDARSEAMRTEMEGLRADGLLPGWWDEPCAVVRTWGDTPVLQIERAAQDPFGLKSYGVHLNGYVRTDAGVELWIARRARDKTSFPGELDHLAAGGQPLGLTRRENMIKESGEEAGLPPEIADRMVAASGIAYRCDLPEGLNDDCIYVYDLEVPSDFEPVSGDGEVEAFERLPVADVLERLRTTTDFKFNVGPVILDFLLRHELLPRDDPEHGAVSAAVAAMRRRAVGA
jgi:isopentenyldiphosphate isomerase